MRVVSLIPSITEMLVAAGINVVGRTRFCIHPADEVSQIPAVAGTKDINWDKVAAVEPDLIIFDREENTKEMADACPYPMFVLHITCIDNVGSEVERLARQLDSTKLHQVAQRWRRVAELPPIDSPNLARIPAELSRFGIQQTDLSKIERLDYLIWKKPWMAIGPDTFIWSVLHKLGFAALLQPRDAKYPNLGDEIEAEPSCLYLFSSEPFPFARYQKQLEKQGFAGVIVDGECYSWYGVRSLDFLEQELKIHG